MSKRDPKVLAELDKQRKEQIREQNNVLRSVYHGLESSKLPGIADWKKNRLLQEYKQLPDNRVVSLARAVRAQRALDIIDMVHADIPQWLESLPERERLLWIKILKLTNKLIPKLKGVSNG